MKLWQRIVNLVSRPQQLGAPRTYMPARQAGVLVNEDTAMTFAAIWACVSLISRTIAALPWQVYERTADGRKAVYGTVNWLLNNQPNPEMTAFSFREMMMVHVLTWGNAYAEIRRDLSGRVVELWPLTPDRVTPWRNEAGEIVYRVCGVNGDDQDMPASQIMHVHGMGFDGLVGYSPIRMAARSIGIGIAQDVFAAAFYANGTVFGTLLEMPGAMSPEQIATAEKYHNEKFRGPDRAFGVKVAPAGVKVHPNSMPLVDAQFIESRNLSVTEAARLYGVPPHKIADLLRSTNNNIEHQGIEFVQDAIVPWSVRLEQEANIKLFAPRAQGRVYTKIAVNALMRGDSKARAEYYRTMMNLGVYTINEVRALEEENGIGPDGDQRLVQLNLTTLEWLVANPAGTKAAPPPVDEPADPVAYPEQAPAPPTNVIRAEALAYMRQQRKQA